MASLSDSRLFVLFCTCVFEGFISHDSWNSRTIRILFKNILKYHPFLLLMSSCKIAKTIKVDKIIINTNSVSKESLTSSRFKTGNLLLWLSPLVIFEKKWFFNWDQNDCKNTTKIRQWIFCDHVPEQILIRTNRNFRLVELGHLTAETEKQSDQSHVMH